MRSKLSPERPAFLVGILGERRTKQIEDDLDDEGLARKEEGYVKGFK